MNYSYNNPLLFTWYETEEELNTILGHRGDLGYKNVLLFFDIMQDESMEVAERLEFGLFKTLNFNEEEFTDQEQTKEFIEKLVIILKSARFSSPQKNDDAYNKYQAGIYSEEDYRAIKAAEPTLLDFKADYDLIYSLYLKNWGINLLNDNINYFIFLAHLENLLLEDNALTKRIEARSFKSKSGKGYTDYNRAGNAMKEKYRI